MISILFGWEFLPWLLGDPITELGLSTLELARLVGPVGDGSSYRLRAVSYTRDLSFGPVHTVMLKAAVSLGLSNGRSVSTEHRLDD